MKGFQSKHGFIDMSNVNFNCPHCNQSYDDTNNKYVNRCNKNYRFWTRITCIKCGLLFYMSYNIKGDAVSFVYQTVRRKPIRLRKDITR